MFFNFLFQRQASRVGFEIKCVQVLKLNRVSHGDDLGVGLAEQRAHIDLPLAAATNDCDIDLLARRDKFWTAKDMAWNQGEPSHRGGCSAKKPPPVQLGVEAWRFRFRIN